MSTSKNVILIAGGSGLIGDALRNHFTKTNNEVIILTRNQKLAKQSGFAFWNPAKEIIDELAFKKATVLINLSGTSIAARWTKINRETILSSRLQPIIFLAKVCKKHNKTFDSIICASAIGIYPQTTKQHELFIEETMPGFGFLSETVSAWENANSLLAEFGKFSQIRIGVVLAKHGGMLQTLIPLFKKGLGSIIASGKQGISWIHIQDLVSIFDHVVSYKTEGTFNAVAPNPVSQEEFSKTLAMLLGKKLWAPNTPSLILRLILGKQAMLATHGAYVSCEKITSYDYNFEFTKLENALAEILSKN